MLDAQEEQSHSGERTQKKDLSIEMQTTMNELHKLQADVKTKMDVDKIDELKREMMHDCMEQIRLNSVKLNLSKDDMSAIGPIKAMLEDVVRLLADQSRCYALSLGVYQVQLKGLTSVCKCLLAVPYVLFYVVLITTPKQTVLDGCSVSAFGECMSTSQAMRDSNLCQFRARPCAQGACCWSYCPPSVSCSCYAQLFLFLRFYHVLTVHHEPN